MKAKNIFPFVLILIILTTVCSASEVTPNLVDEENSLIKNVLVTSKTKEQTNAQLLIKDNQLRLILQEGSHNISILADKVKNPEYDFSAYVQLKIYQDSNHTIVLSNIGSIRTSITT